MRGLGLWVLAMALAVLAVGCAGTPPGCEVTGCPVGQQCNPATHACIGQSTPCEVSGCLAGQECNTTTHQCVAISNPGACAMTCAADQVCVSGTCTPCGSTALCTAGLSACEQSNGCSACRSNTCGGTHAKCEAGKGCSACLSNTDCTVASPYCAAPHCVECLSDGNCTGGKLCRGGHCSTPCVWDDDCSGDRPYCNYTTDVCVACFQDTDCPTGLGCYSGTCRPGLSGDVCATAIPVTLSASPLVVKGSTYRYSGEAVWYALTVPSDSLLSLSLATSMLSGSRDLLLTARCEGGYTDELDRDDAQLQDVFVAAGTYYVRVYVSPTSGGFITPRWDYTLTLTATAASRAPGNHCTKAILLPVGAPGGQDASVAGDTTGLSPLPNGGCGASGGLVYKVNLQEHSMIRATLSPAAPADLALSMHGGNCHTSLGVCGASDGGAPITTTLKDLAPGEVSLFVQTRADAGAYQLDVLTKPYPKNNTCAKAEVLTFDGGVAQVTSDTTDVNATTSGCDLYDEEPAVHYTFSTVGQGVRALNLDLLSQQTGQGQVSLTTACRTTSSNRPDLCGQNNVDNPQLPEGNYQVQVAEAGAFTLRATLGPPLAAPANDLCANAQDMALVGGAFGPVAGDTRGAGSELTYSCGYGHQLDQPGRDVVFRLPVPGRGRVQATLTPLAATFNPFLQLSTSCDTYAYVNCGESQDAGVAEVVSGRASSEAYFWIDAEDGTEGPFELSGSFTPAPAHDLCASALPIAFGETLSGSISEAFPDTNACEASTSPEANLFYTFTAPSNGQATVTLVPSGFDGEVGILVGGCGAASCSGVNSGTIGVTETYTFAVSRNGVYVIVVQGRPGLQPDPAGTFTLSLAGP
jgi:hypothetical protein